MSYKYSLIRFVPDPAKGEAVNLGALAGDDVSGDWDLRLISNLKRAKAIDTSGALSAALAYIGLLQDHFDALGDLQLYQATAPMSLDLLAQLRGDLQNVVQLSPVAPVVAQTAAEALDLVFDQLLVDPESREFRFEKKHRAVASIEHAYRANEIPPAAIRKRVTVASAPFESTFDFAVQNGEVVQLVQCWSFQLPNQVDLAEEVRAWAWMVQELRRQGGEVRQGTERVNVPYASELDIAAVYIPPLSGGQAPAFDQAQRAFEELNVAAVTPEGAAAVGERASQLLASRTH